MSPPEDEREPRFFRASYDALTKIASAGVLFLLAGIAAATRSQIVIAIGAAIFFLSFALSPRGYFVGGRSIRVKRLIGNPEIPLDGLREARALSGDDLRGCIRLFGSGGLFGYYGLFRTSALGRSTWYVTSRARIVLLSLAAKTVLLSPDDTAGFLAALKISAPAQPAGTADDLRFSLLSGNRGASGSKPIGAAIGVCALALSAFAMLYSPGPPRLTLTPGSLTVHDRFYPITIGADTVDVADVRIVNLGPESPWRPVRRTNGFGNGRYQSGWFRLANGNIVRMYRSGGRQLVLLPPAGKGAAVLLQTANPAQFIEDLRRAWPAH